ncbi:MAG: hypothetical protein JW726_05220 [Anaerolineales bacterium]|nr:hypothetical protein [Anaerolineales bacterium]
MQYYTVEGLYLTRKGLKKAQKTGRIAAGDIELFAKAIWANNPEEAVEIATQELAGGEWREKPRVSKKTEEQRMRSLGMPELPGISAPPRQRLRK